MSKIILSRRIKNLIKLLISSYFLSVNVFPTIYKFKKIVLYNMYTKFELLKKKKTIDKKLSVVSK